MKPGKVNHVELTTLEQSVLRGTLSGDGNLHVGKKRSKNAVLQLSHSINQRDWLTWKYTVLRRLFSCRLIWEKNGELHIQSRAYVELTDLYNEVYLNGVKIFNRLWLDRLDDLALAVWFCDDGTYDNNRKTTAPRMCLTDLDDNQVRLVSTWFNDNGLGHTICGKRDDHSRELYFGGNNAERFMMRVVPYVPDCMQYKLGTYRQINAEVSHSDPN